MSLSRYLSRFFVLLVAVHLWACEEATLEDFEQAIVTNEAAEDLDAQCFLKKKSGDYQSGIASETLADPFVVEAYDGDGGVLSGYEITYSIGSGKGASLSSESGKTDANGIHEVHLTPGPAAGTYTVLAQCGSATVVFFTDVSSNEEEVDDEENEENEDEDNSSETPSSGTNREVTLLTLNPSAYDFGAITLNTTSTKEVVLTNAGDTAITIGSISVNGDSSFSQASDCGTSLNVESSCTVTVSFTPTSSNTVNTLLNIDYNGGSQKAMSLIGRGGSSLTFNGIDSLTNVGATSAQLNWSAATGGSVSSYQVQRKVGGSWTVIAILANTVTYYVNTGLTPATSYSWRVFAMDAFGVPDGNSVVKTAATNVVDFEAIDPGELSLTEEDATSITLSCADNEGNTPTYSLLSLSDTDLGCSLSGSTLSCTPVNKAGHSDWTATANLRCTIDGANIDYSPEFAVSDYSRPPVLTVPANREYPNHVPVGTNMTLNSTATDADGDTITYACTVASTNLDTGHDHYAASGTNCDDLTAIQGTNASFNETTGSLSWTPAINQIAAYEFTITASDAYGGSDTETFHIVVGEPWSQDNTPVLELDTRFADSGTDNGIDSQTTTWTDLSGNEIGVTINGTGDNAGDHWLGDGTSSSPYRLKLDGTNDYVEIDVDSMTDGRKYTYLYFRVPSSAADGTHTIVSFGESFGVAYIKGAGENRLYVASYRDAGDNNYGAVNSLETDTWYKLYVYDEDGIEGTSNGRHTVDVGPIFGTSTVMNATRFDPQTAVGDHQTYLGYKPSAVGIGSGPLAQGTAVYGNIEILAMRMYHNTLPGDDWNGQREYFLTERLKTFPMGDTRLPSLTAIFDAASPTTYGYKPYAEGIECETASNFVMATGAIEDYGYLGFGTTLTGVSNAACASDSTGWRGTGGAANPYRLAFDGTDDFLLFGGNGVYSQQQYFSASTLENSIDIWFRANDGDNTTVSNGYGRGLVLNYEAHASTNASALLGLLDNGNGTSVLQLYFTNPSETVDVKDTGVNVTNGVWNHVALTMNAGGDVKLYLNGALSYTGAGLISDYVFLDDATCNSGGRRCYYTALGGSNTASAGDFNGAYLSGDISLYRTYFGHELSASEVLYNCNHDKGRFSGSICSP